MFLLKRCSLSQALLSMPQEKLENSEFCQLADVGMIRQQLLIQSNCILFDPRLVHENLNRGS
jgi:hypothetical protein